MIGSRRFGAQFFLMVRALTRRRLHSVPAVFVAGITHPPGPVSTVSKPGVDRHGLLRLARIECCWPCLRFSHRRHAVVVALRSLLVRRSPQVALSDDADTSKDRDRSAEHYGPSRRIPCLRLRITVQRRMMRILRLFDYPCCCFVRSSTNAPGWFAGCSVTGEGRNIATAPGDPVVFLGHGRSKQTASSGQFSL